jgi:hypothetical protein
MTFRLKMLQRSPQPPKQAILKNISRKIYEESQTAKEKAASRSRLNSIDLHCRPISPPRQLRQLGEIRSDVPRLSEN